ncbi:YHS domain protein [Nocardiopsis sp. CT-R113]|uniref:YHS domain protein n=1 Tax=Nocardiopsis codii TaxID=3065942 RepID=A0ABU7KEQ2_9ACTN|nr:YHS domain protein [Nocardiopsis sp. CT-R113]MEE2040492.1 YHS domain protein [Nocardiopsis sp. CT-R113]
MIFIELFVPRGSLGAEPRRRLAERLGNVVELTHGEETQEGWEAVLGSLLQVVVHEPELWVVDQRLLESGAAPRYLVRIHVPAPWRKAMSEHMITYVTKVISEVESDARRPYLEPVVQVQVLGVTEGSYGLLGRATDSDGIVELMNEPYREEYERGRAVLDPICKMYVPLNDTAITLEWEGTLHGFCCTACREEFLEKRQKAAARG